MRTTVVGIGLVLATAIIGCGGTEVEEPSNDAEIVEPHDANQDQASETADDAEMIEPRDANQSQANAVADGQWLQIPDDSAQTPNILDSTCRSIDEDGSSVVHVMNYLANDQYIDGWYEPDQVTEEDELQDPDSLGCVGYTRNTEDPEATVRSVDDGATRVYWNVSSIRQSQLGYRGTVFTFGLQMWIDDSYEQSDASFDCKVTANAAGDAATVSAGNIISEEEYDTLYYERMCLFRHQLNESLYLTDDE